MKSNRYRHGSKSNRQGAAIVEFAVCLPLIFLIVLGSIQGASLLFLKQTLVQASYEGAKVGIRDGDEAAMRQAVEAVATGRRVQGLALTISPSNIANLPSGETVTVTVSAPGDDNSLFPFGPFQGQQVTAQAVMVRE